MKTASIILSAGVCAGLASYAFFNGVFGFGLLSNQVVINIDVFVGLIATTAILGAVLALAFRRAIARSDDRMVARLERRIAELETRAASDDRVSA